MNSREYNQQPCFKRKSEGGVGVGDAGISVIS